MSEWGNKTKLKRITIDVYYEETRAIEDLIWCQNSPEELEGMHPHLSSFWTKLASAYDSSKQTIRGEEE